MIAKICWETRHALLSIPPSKMQTKFQLESTPTRTDHQLTNEEEEDHSDDDELYKCICVTVALLVPKRDRGGKEKSLTSSRSSSSSTCLEAMIQSSHPSSGNLHLRQWAPLMWTHILQEIILVSGQCSSGGKKAQHMYLISIHWLGHNWPSSPVQIRAF